MHMSASCDYIQEGVWEMLVNSKGLVTNYGEGGATKQEGGGLGLTL